MQKIVIKNFGPIEDAEIDIKKILVLIGEQASGKSTIAKLIYFFQSLRDDLFRQIFDATEDIHESKTQFDIATQFAFSIKEKFLDWFGSKVVVPSFELTYYFDTKKKKFVELSVKKSKLYVVLSKGFFDTLFLDDAKAIQNQLDAVRKESSFWRKLFSSESPLNKKLLSNVNTILGIHQESQLYIVAGRSATVNYSELFEKQFFSTILNNISENQKNRITSIDDILMYNFISRVIELKREYNLPVFEPIDYWGDGSDSSAILKKTSEKNVAILKGEYSIENKIEQIRLSNSTQVITLAEASSGQQESLRILLDTLDIIRKTNQSKALRIIEEPEAHLFPVAQKHLVELLALMVNQNEYNQLIITTHSPYILSVFNNLLFAQRVVSKNQTVKKEVANVIDKDFWLNASDFAAYSLSNKALGSEQKYCEAIFDEATGLIAQNYLDTVSEMLSGEFSKLYSIHAKTFARK